MGSKEQEGSQYEKEALTRPEMTTQHEQRSAVNSTLFLRSKREQIKITSNKEKHQQVEAEGSWSHIHGSLLRGADPNVSLRVRIQQLKKLKGLQEKFFRKLHLTMGHPLPVGSPSRPCRHDSFVV